jgi:2-oxoglutarate ferredoxin oxidoreductase subunit beta
MTSTTTESARPGMLRPISFHYCGGCGHSVLHRLIAEVIEELNLSSRTIGVSSVGCSFLMYDFLDVDFASAPPGRAPSVATGLKRAQPAAAVFTYQGDTDALGGGLGDLLHAVSRNELITVFVVNNAATGLSGGHLSPTTPPQQKTKVTPAGRDVAVHGYPIKICEMVASCGTPARVERVALDGPAGVEKAKVAVREAFRHPMDGKGLALLEVLSACPTYWNLSPDESLTHITRHMAPQFPLGKFGPNGERK